MRIAPQDGGSRAARAAFHRGRFDKNQSSLGRFVGVLFSSFSSVAVRSCGSRRDKIVTTSVNNSRVHHHVKSGGTVSNRSNLLSRTLAEALARGARSFSSPQIGTCRISWWLREGGALRRDFARSISVSCRHRMT